jgi:hypothetical protein
MPGATSVRRRMAFNLHDYPPRLECRCQWEPLIQPLGDRETRREVRRYRAIALEGDVP